jgi:formate-dependent nitrite reductase membrane component NrfD
MSARPELGATQTPGPDGRSRYGRPVIKEPTWTPEIPAYFFVGGLAGASAGLALLSDLRGEHGVARRAWATALAGSIVSPALLISDLGVPRRFLHMLRLVKVTSPMSIGSWVLACFGAVTAPAALHAFTGGALGRPGRVAQVAAALLGLPLASYTAALVSNTAVPVWHEARLELPFVFVAGAASSAGAAAAILAPVGEAGAARRLAIGGAAAEMALTALMEHRLDRAGLGTVYHEGRVRGYARAAKTLTALGVLLMAVRGARSRAAAVAGGALLTGGAIAERWAIFRAGFASARRPQDTVGPQRARIAAGQSRGAARRRSPRAAGPPTGGAQRPGERPVTPGSPAIAP